MFMGRHEAQITKTNDRYQYNYCDLIANGDCFMIAQIIKENPGYGVRLLSYAMERYYKIDRLFEERTTNYLRAFVYSQDNIISADEFGMDNDH